MTVGKKITLTCAALVALNVASTAISIGMAGKIKQSATILRDNSLPSIGLTGAMTGHTKDQRLAMMEHIASLDPAVKAQLESRIADLDGKIRTLLSQHEATIIDAKERELFDRTALSQDRMMQAWARVEGLSRALTTKEALDMWRSSGEPAGNERARFINELSAYNESHGKQNAGAAVSSAHSATLWGAIVMAVSIGVGIILSWSLGRGLRKTLNHTVNEVASGAEQIISASRQLAASSQSLALGASRTAASLEETSASTEELTSMTRRNEEHARTAALEMKRVDERITQANRSLDEMIGSMREVESSSEKISKIIRVIDEIAFQTNILALNAAVEAARAGEAGMGFAVVADEVRSLAQRSAQAAKDTAVLIEESIRTSGEGAARLNQMVQVVASVTESARKVKSLIDSVDAGSQEQAQGIAQIARAVTEMDQVTQSTAASAEESASASEEMQAQVQSLHAVVHQLRDVVGSESR